MTKNNSTKRREEPSGVRSWTVPHDLYVPKETKKWDECPIPLPEEIFLSWFVRVAQANCSTPITLFNTLLRLGENSTKTLEQIERDIQLKNNLIEHLAPYLKIDTQSLRILPLRTPKRRLASIGWNFLNIPLKNPRYCPFCLEGDAISYYRYFWHLPFITVCSTHKCLLLDCCPHCYYPIQYWEVDWNKSITSCPQCEQNLTKEILFIQNLENSRIFLFQDQMLAFYHSGKFQGQVIGREFFFRQLWKIASIESVDPAIRELDKEFYYELPVERVFKAIYSALKAIELNPERINHPLEHQIDQSKLENNSQLSPKELGLAESRLKIIQSLIENPARTVEDIKDKANEHNLDLKTIYVWMNRYRDGGLAALVPRYHERGRRIKSSPEMKEMMKNTITNYIIGQSKSIRSSWIRFTTQCSELGYSKSEIPSYATFLPVIVLPFYEK